MFALCLFEMASLVSEPNAFALCVHLGEVLMGERANLAQA